MPPPPFSRRAPPPPVTSPLAAPLSASVGPIHLPSVPSSFLLHCLPSLTLFAIVGTPLPLHAPWLPSTVPPLASLYRITPITLLLPFPAPPELEHSLHLLPVISSDAIVATSPATDGVDFILSSNQPPPYPCLHLHASPSSSTSLVFLMVTYPSHVCLSLCRHHLMLRRLLPSAETSPTTLRVLSLPLPFVEHLPTCLTSVLFSAIPMSHRSSPSTHRPARCRSSQTSSGPCCMP